MQLRSGALVLEALRGEKVGLLKREANSQRRAYRETGTILNSLHRLPPPPGGDSESLSRFLADRRLDMKAIESTYGSTMRRRFEAALDLLATQIPGTDSVFAHRDFNTDQVLALEDGTVTAFIDWERAGIGSRLLELGNFIMHIHYRTHHGMEIAFLDGYAAGNNELTRRALAAGALYCWTEGEARSHIDRALTAAGF